LVIFNHFCSISSSGITFSTIFSGARGSIGLMSFSWAAFTLSFSLCVYAQWVNPTNPVFTVVAHPARRFYLAGMILVSTFASFVGIVLMGTAVATLDLNKEGTALNVNTDIDTKWGGILSLLLIGLALLGGTTIFIVNGIKTIYIIRSRQLE
jgi:hypothetical protein